MTWNIFKRTGVAALALCATTGLSAQEKDVQLLFVQTAHSMQADTDAKALRLVGIGAQTVYFSDRPERVAGHIPVAKFVQGWTTGEDSFANNPPNATLSVYMDETEENDLVVVELFDPTIDGQDVTYRYEVLDGVMPASGGASALFIDTFGPGGGVGAGFHGVGVGRRGPGVTGWAGQAVRACEADSDC